MKLIDTDILIDHFHGHQAALSLIQTLIAATAFLHSAELFTRNVKHYPMQDIKVTAPYKRGEK